MADHAPDTTEDLGNDAPMRLHVSTRSGHVRIVARPGGGLDVKGGRVEHEADGVVRIVGAKLGSHGVEVGCPIGTDVIVGTESGTVEARGALRDVRATTRSGRIEIEHARDVDIRTWSGTIEVDECTRSCRVVTKSSRIRLRRVAHLDCSTMSGRIEVDDVQDAFVRTMSGRVAVGTGHDGRIEVRTLSGTVDVEVPRGRRPATHLKSLSGRVRCECEPGDDGEVHVATTSGTIRVSCR